MVKFILLISAIALSTVAIAQSGRREELDKQKQKLKKELDQTEKLLKANKEKSKENFVQWKLITDKVNLQDKIVDNINRDINLLDNNLVTTQRDINRYNKLLDTLKQEYAKSMVYAYKNRSDYDFLNFIFSASNFNDAIKRITYLKSYRNYREMQGENILRTQALRKKRVEELTGIKQQKNVVLQDKDKELSALELQQKEKDRILAELKKQGGQLSAQMANTKKQMRKVDNAIAAAIKRAIAEAKKAGIKKAAEEKAKNDAIAKANAKKAADEKARLSALEKANATNNKTTSPNKTITPNTTVKPPESNNTTIKIKEPSVLLNSENAKLNSNFINNRGALPWPVDKGYPLLHFGRNQLPNGIVIDMTGVSISTDIGTNVKAVFDGVVSAIANIEDIQVVIIQHGKYFTTYSNLGSTNVKQGQNVTLGQVIGKAGANLDGIGAVDFYISDEKNNIDPEKWLRRR